MYEHFNETINPLGIQRCENSPFLTDGIANDAS